MNIWLILHLVTIVPVLLAGPFIFLRQKGDRLHRFLGKAWSIIMIASCIFSFGVRGNRGLSWLHGLAAFTIFSVVRALLAVKNGNLKVHQAAMRGSYIGACVAFIFAVSMPNRLIGHWVHHFFK